MLGLFFGIRHNKIYYNFVYTYIRESAGITAEPKTLVRMQVRVVASINLNNKHYTATKITIN